MLLLLLPPLLPPLCFSLLWRPPPPLLFPLPLLPRWLAEHLLQVGVVLPERLVLLCTPKRACKRRTCER